MIKNKNYSIRTKILIAMIVLSVISVLTVTLVAFYITSDTVKEQLILNRRMSSGWLQERLAIESENTMNQLYEYEVNKNIRSDIVTWCSTNKLDYKSILRLIDSMNSTISIDNNINAIEIYNLNNDTVLIANRSESQIDKTKDRLEKIDVNNDNFQKNLSYFRDDDEILAVHQISQFEDKKVIALVMIHQRQYKLQDILSDIKMTG